MLTPRFTCSQTDDNIVVIIQAPYVKFTEVEISIIDYQFTFYCKPYLLRINFLSHVVEDGSESINYNVGEGEFTAKIPKLNKGEHFENLDMITQLLTTKKSKWMNAEKLIEVIENPDDLDQAAELLDKVEDDDIDWTISPELEETESDGKIEFASCKYGFLRKTENLFKVKEEEAIEILALKEPDKVPICQRYELQKSEEISTFDKEYYINDFFAIEDLRRFLEVECGSHSEYNVGENCPVEFTKEELDSLTRLPRKEYILDKEQKKTVYLGLIDILYSILYELRLSGADNCEDLNVESAANISRVGSTFSWLIEHKDLHSTICSCIRRSLCTAYFRHWVICMKVLEDVGILLKKGKTSILKLLLKIHHLFNISEPYYIMNDLYLTDYCVWIQTSSNTRLHSLASEVESIRVSKDSVDLKLTEIEREALEDESETETESSELDSDDSDVETSFTDESPQKINSIKFSPHDENDSLNRLLSKVTLSSTPNTNNSELYSSHSDLETLDSPEIRTNKTLIEEIN